MADWYVDHGCTLYPSAYMSVPASPSSLPQEGDGAASGTGTTPAVAMGSVVFTGSPSGRSAGNISLGGVTVTPSYSDNNDTQANNLATAVNASTGLVTCPSKQGPYQVYVKAMFWARGPSGGAASGTCEIYCRIATDAWNGATVTGSAWNGGGTVTYNNFNSNGVSGPWGILACTTALAAAINANNNAGNGTVGTSGTYGAFNGTAMGSPAAGDWVWMRTKRSGANITCAIQNATNMIGGIVNARPISGINFIADAGVKWSGDAGVLTISLSSSHGAVAIYFNCQAQNFYGNGQRFRILCQDINSTYTGFYPLGTVGTMYGLYDSVLFEISTNSASSATNKFTLTYSANSGMHVVFRNCKFLQSKAGQNNFPFMQARAGTSGAFKVTMENCEIAYTSLGSNPTGKLFQIDVNQGVGGQSVGVEVIINGLKVYDPNNVNQKFYLANFSSVLQTDYPHIFRAENVSGISGAPADLTVGLVGLQAPVSTWNYDTNAAKYSLISTNDHSVYRHETMLGYVDWIQGQSYPTLNSYLPDGTAWALHALWYGQYLTPLMPFRTKLSQFYTAADAVKTLTVELLFDNAISSSDITTEKIALQVSYVDTNGLFQNETTVPSDQSSNATQLSSSAASWTKPGSYSTWNAKKISLTTAQAVKQNTEIQVTLIFLRSCPTNVNGKELFINPEFTIA